MDRFGGFSHSLAALPPISSSSWPSDLAGAVSLFATEAGRWITGQNLTVDGGWSAW